MEHQYKLLDGDEDEITLNSLIARLGDCAIDVSELEHNRNITAGERAAKKVDKIIDDLMILKKNILKVKHFITASRKIETINKNNKNG